MKLSSFTQGKNNNFNLIRIVAAFAVLLGHSFALLARSEPLAQSLGMSIGSIAVDIFFITSGFLVTRSLLVRQSIAEYALSRILRIYPALLVMLILTVFCLGPFFTSNSLSVYFSNTGIYSYFLKCITLVTGVAFYLPGVFESNPFKGAVNGSLWSMVYEIKMYIILSLFWIVFNFNRANRIKLFNYFVVASSIVAGILVLIQYFNNLGESHFVRLYFMFFIGAAFWVLREYINLSSKTFWLFFVALVLSPFINKDVFFTTYLLTIAYILFFLTYVPAGHIRKYNAVGDYSYGVYIYAFPLQQSIVALFPKISVSLLIFTAAVLSLIFAVISWHIFEKPSLNFKKKYD